MGAGVLPKGALACGPEVSLHSTLRLLDKQLYLLSCQNEKPGMQTYYLL